MKFRSLFSALALVAATIVVSGASSSAAIIVLTDSGSIGGFTATNTGVSGNTATVLFSVPSTASQLNTVNGLFVSPEPTAVLGPLTLQVTVTALGAETYNLALVPPTAQQTIGGTVGAQAIETFTLTQGVAPTVLPAFFNMSGRITGLLANNNPTYDFSPFAQGGIQNITLTTNNFGGLVGDQSWANFFRTAGATATGNGSFSQSAVPEPASMAMVGMGLVGTVVAGSIRKRTRKA